MKCERNEVTRFIFLPCGEVRTCCTSFTQKRIVPETMYLFRNFDLLPHTLTPVTLKESFRCSCFRNEIRRETIDYCEHRTLCSYSRTIFICASPVPTELGRLRLWRSCMLHVACSSKRCTVCCMLWFDSFDVAFTSFERVCLLTYSNALILGRCPRSKLNSKVRLSPTKTEAADRGTRLTAKMRSNALDLLYHHTNSFVYRCSNHLTGWQHYCFGGLFFTRADCCMYRIKWMKIDKKDTTAKMPTPNLFFFFKFL